MGEEYLIEGTLEEQKDLPVLTVILRGNLVWDTTALPALALLLGGDNTAPVLLLGKDTTAPVLFLSEGSIVLVLLLNKDSLVPVQLLVEDGIVPAPLLTEGTAVEAVKESVWKDSDKRKAPLRHLLDGVGAGLPATALFVKEGKEDIELTAGKETS